MQSMNFNSEIERTQRVNVWNNVPIDYKNYEGFIYCITHKETKKYYIGKKSFWKRIRRKPLKGKKRVRKETIESKWQEYTGSSDKFNQYIQSEGIDKFNKEILKVCKTKSELSYQELLYQIEYDVLNDPLSFNGIINVRLNKTK